MKKELMTLLILSSISGNAYANSIPQNVYDNLLILEEENYIEHKDVSDLNRKELAKYIAKILEQNHSRYSDILATQIIEDESQLILIKEQEASAKQRYDKIESEYRKVSEQLYRKSIQGVNRLEIMTPLKERHDKLKKEYEIANNEYNQSKIRTHRLELMIESLKSRQIKESSSSNDKVDFALADLRTEFLCELNDMKFFDDEAAKRQLYANTPVRNPIENKFKLDGRVQISHADHHGDDVPKNESKFKISLYGDYDFNRDWHLISAVEAEKVFSPSKEWKTELKNLYVKGKISPDLNVDVGKFSTELGEGNIFDGTLKGAAIYGKNYRIEAGKYKDSDITGITLEKDGFSIGRYTFTNPDKTIYSFGKHIPLSDKWDLGGQFLKGKHDNGYVLSLQYDKDNWEEKSSSYWLKYYYQPSDTYFKHEMNGLADYMLSKDGFKGIGLGWRYVPKKNWAFGLEYFRLNNLLNDNSSNTFFAYLTYAFQTYHED